MVTINSDRGILVSGSGVDAAFHEQALIEEARQFQRKRLRRGWISFAILLAVVVTATFFVGFNGVGSRPANGAPNAISAVGLPSCSISNMTFTGRSGWGGTAGTQYIEIHFVNKAATCQLPQFELRPFNTVTGINVGPAARLFTNLGSNLTAYQIEHQRLNRGEEATVFIGYVDSGNFPPASCRSANSNAIRLFVKGHSSNETTLKMEGPSYILSVCTLRSSVKVFWPLVGNG
jgi:hypothetical protein